MVKVGDKIRILFDGADHANVKRGDEFVVCEVFGDGGAQVSGEYKWIFYPSCYEVIHATPPQKITQNGYEYSLVGPVKPEWLVDGAWVVSRITGTLYKTTQVGNDRFQAIKGDGFNNSGNLTAEEFSAAYRPHEPKDWKWGDWAMYDGKRVFVVCPELDLNHAMISGEGFTDGLKYVPLHNLTPTF